MPTSLTASPAGSSTLNAEEILLAPGIFPPFYPGAAVYPGRGATVFATTATPQTLTGVPA